MSYQAYVTKIATRPFPGADNLILGSCNGFQVIVGKDTVDGQLGIFFETDGQLSEEFAIKNGLLEIRDPVTGERKGGYFKPNRKVKSLKLRGAKSDGFWCPISFVEYTGYKMESLKDGDTFEELNGHPICNKFLTEATRKAQANQAKQGKPRKANPFFPKHVDTGNFRKEAQFIPTGSVIHITSKSHGTSHRYGNVKDEIPFNKFQDFIVNKSYRLNSNLPNFFRKLWTKYTYNYLSGTRNVILNTPTKVGYYGETRIEGFRSKTVRNIILHKGEMIFGEIVGYTDHGALIMPAASTKNLKDKSITKQYGEQMIYRYGQMEGCCDFLVYRITRTNDDGIVTELSWNQVVARCKELSLKTVHHIESFVYDGNLEALMAKVDLLVNGTSGQEAIPDPIDSRHIQEGVVIRAESEFGTVFKKHKSFVFGLLEGFIKDDESYVDTEESS